MFLTQKFLITILVLALDHVSGFRSNFGTPTLHQNVDQKFYEVEITYKDPQVIGRIYDLISQGDAIGPDRIGPQNKVPLAVTSRALEYLRSVPSIEVRALAERRITAEKPRSFVRKLHGDEISDESELDLPSLHYNDLNSDKYGPSSVRTSSFFDSYKRFSAMMAFLSETSKVYPDLVKLEKIGTSYEGRDLVIVKITGPTENCTQKPIIWIDAGIHAREWIAPASGFYIINQLTSEYQNNSQIRQLVDQFEWHIFPMVNPDGYEYSHTTSRMWRKTRSRASLLGCVGVDANRNFGYKWMFDGASSSPCSEIYAGPSAFSEPETQAIRDYLLQFKKDNSSQVAAYLTLHAYSEQWLYPWGYNTEVPDNWAQLDKLAQLAVSSMRKTNLYTVGPSGKTLYPAAGGSDDWAMAEAGISFSYTIELSPASNSGSAGFSLPAHRIRPVGEEIFTAIKSFATGLKEYIPDCYF